MSKTSPETTLISSQVFLIHKNPVFRPGFLLIAQYKARVYDSAVGDILQNTCAVSYGNLCHLKRRHHYPFSNRGLQQEESVWQKRRGRRHCMLGHFNTFTLSASYLFEVSRHGWSRISSSIRPIAPAAWITQRAATQEPCALAYTQSPLLGLARSCHKCVEHIPRLW